MVNVMPVSSKSADLEIQSFATPAQFKTWLKKYHLTSPGIWLRFFKKASGVKTIVYAEALDEALCYGWIDSQVKSYDTESYIQRFTPRRPKSMWSKKNREHVARLIQEKRMQPDGQREIDAAKADGRWDQAYDSPKNTVIPDDLLQALARNKQAGVFFKTLNKSNVYAIVWRLQTAKKAETRARRLEAMVDMLARKEAIHLFKPKEKS